MIHRIEFREVGDRCEALICVARDKNYAPSYLVKGKSAEQVMAEVSRLVALIEAKEAVTERVTDLD